jgi:hypothetical protein
MDAEAFVGEKTVAAPLNPDATTAPAKNDRMRLRVRLSMVVLNDSNCRRMTGATKDLQLELVPTVLNDEHCEHSLIATVPFGETPLRQEQV